MAQLPEADHRQLNEHTRRRVRGATKRLVAILSSRFLSISVIGETVHVRTVAPELHQSHVIEKWKRESNSHDTETTLPLC